jgi:hypothetical protein
MKTPTPIIKSSKGSSSILFYLALAFFMASLLATFAAESYYMQTCTAPLTQLTLSQPACEYLSQSGIPTNVKNNICRITVRYRAMNFQNSGYIEVTGKPPLKIREALIVASEQLDDGSKEPWTAEHKKAFRYLLIGVGLTLVSLAGVALVAIRSARK